MKVGGRRPLAPDAEVIRALAGLLAETGLTEIEYAIGDHRIRVAREPQLPAAPPPSAANGHTANGYAGAGHALPPPAPAEPAPADDAAAVVGALTSPMVGVAYLAPQPGAAPFVQIGERVSEGQTLLIIEAMKVMNQIRAPRAGQVTRVFIEDATPVEYGAPLLLIE
ncbi:MAG TPA: acetyl-CoA carboxylase biotin carboxyl carrier protein [Stellaceae bacterium]|nr:acetyl-CoA carboxylase biotin carboxyl carrier protein [Stellaceae bacterium]